MSASAKDVNVTLPEVKSSKENDGVSAQARLQDIIQKALQSDNPLLQKALKQEQAFRARTEEELHDLLSSIWKLMSEQNPEQAKKAALERLATDLELITSLNKALESYQPKDTQPKDYKAGDETTCTYPLKFNKMALAIPGAQTLITQHFEDIFCKGTLPKGFAYRSKPSDITIIGENPYSIYGNSKGTFLKTAAFSVHLNCTGTGRLQDINLRKLGKSWIHDSAMAHVTYLPQKLDLIKIDPRFAKFTYFFSDDSIPQGLAYVHSGYTFGGQRDTSSCYQMGTKLYGPEDCSSWIAKLSGSPIQFSTIDQLYSYRLQTLKAFNVSLGIVPADYANTQTARVMEDLFEPVRIQDPQKDICPGQLYAHRSYDLTQDAPMQGPGSKGGHTGIVLDFISAGKESNLVVLAYARDMPKDEGFGIQQFPYAPENRKVMLFSTRAQKLSEKSNAQEAVISVPNKNPAKRTT